MGESPRPEAEIEADTRGDGIRQRMESVAEQAVHIGATLKEILDSTKEQMASENRWHEPATVMAVKAQQVRSTIKSRRLREDVFGENLFGEPAWDMLLALYILDVSGQRQTTGTLMHFSGAPVTTARRWLDYLVENGFAQRAHHPTDQRILFVSLTAKGRGALDLYYSETIETEV